MKAVTLVALDGDRFWTWQCPDCPVGGREFNQHDAEAARRKHRGRKHPERVRAEARAAS